MKGPSPCEPSAVPPCEEKGSAKPSPENQGSPGNQGSHKPSDEPFSHEGSNEASEQASGRVHEGWEPSSRQDQVRGQAQEAGVGGEAGGLEERITAEREKGSGPPG